MPEANNLIFLSIASYRDQQLVPTIEDCLAKAGDPSRLRFGICWQHGPDEGALPFADDPRFRILDVDYRDSQGACWARAEIMKLWDGEAWFLQIDSHCRFTQGFDEELLKAAALTGSAKPILSTYASPFRPGDQEYREVLIGVPNLMAISGFDADGLPQLTPVEIPGWQTRTLPRRARFLAGGFLFAPGAFVSEVGYDPELYFFGEEITMTLRAFTHGYDLFHPHRIVVWHDYVRAYATRHWDDHAPESQSSGAWDRREATSRQKIISLLRGEPQSSFGLGSARTLADYEAYSGISFQLRKMQDDTRRSLEPPNAPLAPDWPEHIYPWMVRVRVDPARMSPVAFVDQAFWCVTLQDEDRNEIHRRDFTADELSIFTGQEPEISLVCELESGIVPAFWTLRPVHKKVGWLSELRGPLQDGDYAIVRDDDDLR